MNGLSEKEILIGQKVASSPYRLDDIVSNRRGAMIQSIIEEKGNAFIIGGKQIQRYSIVIDNKRKVNRNIVADATAYISENSVLVQNIVAHVQNPKPHILITATVPEQKIIQSCLLLDTVNQLQNKSDYSSKFIVGVLNSSLIGWYVYRFIYAKAIRTMHFDSSSTNKIPFPSLDLTNKIDKAKHDEIEKLVNQLLQLNQDKQDIQLATKAEHLQGKIEYCENRINHLVYELYDLTEEEIALVES